MSEKRSPTVELMQLVSQFESLRQILLTEKYELHRRKPLAHWALPTDRRLPLAFMDRTIGELIHTPFARLMGTPGVGHKKIATFIQLLHRVVQTDPAELDGEPAAVVGPQVFDADALAASDDFDVDAVSEVVWEQWRKTVAQHGLEQEFVGRFAPSLRNLTRAVWKVPLGFYTRRTLAEIRALKTHGAKRIRSIMEIFRLLHNMLSKIKAPAGFAVRLAPKAIFQAEAWLLGITYRDVVPTREEVATCFVEPLLQQLEIDASAQLADLARSRLGVGRPQATVRGLSQQLKLTRARIYQLFDEIATIMSVRWPNGGCALLQALSYLERQTDGDADSAWQLLHAATGLFFPHVASLNGHVLPIEEVAELPTDEPEQEVLSQSQSSSGGNGQQ